MKVGIEECEPPIEASPERRGKAGSGEVEFKPGGGRRGNYLDGGFGVSVLRGWTGAREVDVNDDAIMDRGLLGMSSKGVGQEDGASAQDLGNP